MSVAPILRFFEPLKVWLEKKNQENGDVPGWTTMDSKDEEWRKNKGSHWIVNETQLLDDPII